MANNMRKDKPSSLCGSVAKALMCFVVLVVLLLAAKDYADYLRDSNHAINKDGKLL
jgi:hypothetical protein